MSAQIYTFYLIPVFEQTKHATTTVSGICCESEDFLNMPNRLMNQLTHLHKLMSCDWSKLNKVEIQTL